MLITSRVQLYTAMSELIPNIPNGVKEAAYEDINFISGNIGTMTFENLTSSEIAMFDRDLRLLAYMTSLQRDLSSILLEQRDAFLVGASIAKKQFGVPFRGLNGTGGFNMQLIRPVTVLSNIPTNLGGGGGTPVLTWKRYFSQTGWQALFGNPSNPVNLGVTGNGTSAMTTYKRVLMEIPYLLSTGPSPKVQEIQISVLQTTYPVYPLSWLKLSDIYIAKLPGVLFANLNGTFSIQANIGTTGVDEIIPLGLQFVTSDYAVLQQ